MKTAVTTYQAALSDVARLLDVLQLELDKQASQPETLRRFAVAEAVRSTLINAVGMMTNMSDADVCEFLDDASAEHVG
jgi:hypothetical protein